jgi:hypothetical protein
MRSLVTVTRQKGMNPMFPKKPDSPLDRQVLTVLAIATLLIMPVTAAFIDQIGDYAVGDNVTISGSTNISVGDKVWVTVSSSDFHPTSKYESIEQLSGESKASGTVRATEGPGANGKNVWTIGFPTTGWDSGMYTVRAADATSDNSMLWASATFQLFPDRTAVPQRTVSPPKAQVTLSVSGVQNTNSSVSTPGAGSTIPTTTPGNNGDFNFLLPVIVISGLLLFAGCGYYVIKIRPHQTTPSPVLPVMKTEHDGTGEKNSPDSQNLIFLSAKSEDYEDASHVYSYLTEHGYSVFFSNQTLPRMGNSDYRREIDRALEQAKHLVLVTSCKEYVESKWVEAEWGSFINEKRSGRKNGNIIVLLGGSMQIGDLPISLRSFETRFLDNPKTLGQILSYLS